MSEVTPLILYQELIDYIREKAIKVGLVDADLSFEPNSKKCALVLNKCSLLYKNASFIELSDVCTLKILRKGALEVADRFSIKQNADAVVYFTKEAKGATKGKVVIACPGDIQLKEDCSNLFSMNEDYIYEPDPFTGTINFSGVDTSMARSMESMFMDCKAKHLDLSGFNTSKVTNMRKMFKDCKDLQSINLSGFNTERVTGMEFLFTRCCSLEHIDLSSFNTSNVESMAFMFASCNRLDNIDLSGFDTSNLTDTQDMFVCCAALKSINLRNFNASKVTRMSSMFMECKSLESLDMSGFDTSKVYYMERRTMLSGCTSLKHVYLPSNGSCDNMIPLLKSKGITYTTK